MLNSTSPQSRLLSRLHDARAETDALFAIVKPEFMFERPIAERHRLAFYVGHLEAFDWNLLSAPLGLPGEHPALDALFAFGIDPVDGQLPSDEPSDWPPLQEFFRYREQARARLDAALHRDDLAGSEGTRLDQLLHVAIEHRQMHAETLSYLMHRMPFDHKRGSDALGEPAPRYIVPQTVDIPAGKTTLGASRSSGEFGWDNEFEAHTVDVPAFVIDKYKVTNRQYLEFVDDRGYSRREFWGDADWSWKEANAIRHPAFWLRQDGQWHWRSMFNAIPLPPDWPVYVSHAEASAYARWVGRRLPSEAQWQRAAFGADGGAAIDDFSDAPLRFDPIAVDAVELLPAGPFPVAGMRGNGWEWTSSIFAPFAGFRRFDFYPGYSEPFFDGKHFVLKGGSARTATAMLRPGFRNWFQPHYPYVYAGFRCVDRQERPN
ncbi:MAG TPA: SUMF1/EgtB/PvdO family nonheme iron enzyme [Rudaea sp.]|nr:SUMF1/EgtB/PvdO family nonheme iron enzyme [Rudaea sp.]